MDINVALKMDTGQQDLLDGYEIEQRKLDVESGALVEVANIAAEFGVYTSVCMSRWAYRQFVTAGAETDLATQTGRTRRFLRQAFKKALQQINPRDGGEQSIPLVFEAKDPADNPAANGTHFTLNYHEGDRGEGVITFKLQ